MAKKSTGNSPKPPATSEKAKKTGMAALVMAILIGPLVWLVGPTSENDSLGWLKSFIIAVALALVIRWIVAEPFRIPSGSMETTLHGNPHILKGDRVFVNKMVYGLRFPLNGCRIPFTKYRLDYANRRVWEISKPERFDIVVFKSAEPGAMHTTLVKRVIGLPGERIHIANGKVYVNGEPIEMPPELDWIEYTSPSYVGTGFDYGILADDEHALVPEDCYLVLGDNSARSRDGRVFGWLPNERILGRVSCIWWPPNRWRDFTGFSKTLWWRSLVTLLGTLLVMRVFFGRSWRFHHRPSGDKPKTDHAYINRWAYGLPIPFTLLTLFQWGRPTRGDLVLYRRPSAPKDEPNVLVGRVAGLPGERVFIEKGKLQIDDAVLDAPACLAEREFPTMEGVGRYARSKGKDFSLVPEEHYFVLTESDLPEEHWDSRTVGWVARKHLIGRASVVWWPPMRWRRLR
ncbi:MAG: signal peptidase I [Nitrospiraceae bacterium]|nr:signal peptidase I [Nitrospiraceae bacterium]